MAESALLETELRYVTAAGADVVTTLGAVDAARVVSGRQVRPFHSRSGQGNYPGWLWTTTTRSLVGYESLLERDRLWLADFDRDVCGIASQPFWCRAVDEGVVRRHAPDFMLEHRDGSFLVVDVKPEHFLDHPKVSAVFAWTGRLCAARGWRYEVWSGAPEALLANVRFVAAGRQVHVVAPEAVAAAAALDVQGLTIREAESFLGSFDQSVVRRVALGMIWCRAWEVDMSVPLSASSVITGTTACEAA